ncbi:18941_t:CDS:1, partial [Dentiscutata erythropus]
NPGLLKFPGYPDKLQSLHWTKILNFHPHRDQIVYKKKKIYVNVVIIVKVVHSNLSNIIYSPQLPRKV